MQAVATAVTVFGGMGARRKQLGRHSQAGRPHRKMRPQQKARQRLERLFQRKSEPGLYSAQQAVLEQARLAAEKLLQRASPPEEEQSEAS